MDAGEAVRAHDHQLRTLRLYVLLPLWRWSSPKTCPTFVAEVGFDVGAGASNEQVAVSVGVSDPLCWETHVGREHAASTHPERHQTAGRVDLDPVDGADVTLLRPHPSTRCDVLLGRTETFALANRDQRRPIRCRSE